MSKKILLKNIKLLWERSGLSQEEFGVKYGSNKKAAWTYISGVSMPGAEFILNLCKDIGVEHEFLSSTLLTFNGQGDITNLPKQSVRFSKLKEQADKLEKEFAAAYEKYHKGMLGVMSEMQKLK